MSLWTAKLDSRAGCPAAGWELLRQECRASHPFPARLPGLILPKGALLFSVPWCLPQGPELGNPYSSASWRHGASAPQGPAARTVVPALLHGVPLSPPCSVSSPGGAASGARWMVPWAGPSLLLTHEGHTPEQQRTHQRGRTWVIAESSGVDEDAAGGPRLAAAHLLLAARGEAGQYLLRSQRRNTAGLGILLLWLGTGALEQACPSSWTGQGDQVTVFLLAWRPGSCGFDWASARQQLLGWQLREPHSHSIIDG
ncbi:hypothetical protein CB1_000208001 [Camelus ferus]|nr:hypothetical protein CB1_000208001 [Camelus ferus]